MPGRVAASQVQRKFKTATAAQQEAASDSTALVSPSVMNDHPSVCKCWTHVTVASGTPTPFASDFEIGTIDDDGAGNYGIHFTTAFSSVNYVCLLQALGASASAEAVVDSKGTGAAEVEIRVAGGGLTDNINFTFAAWGDQ